MHNQKLANKDKSIIQEQLKKSEALKEWYAKAEEMQADGETEITMPIDILLHAKQIPKNVEAFWEEAIYRRLRTNS